MRSAWAPLFFVSFSSNEGLIIYFGPVFRGIFIVFIGVAILFLSYRRSRVEIFLLDNIGEVNRENVMTIDNK